MNKNVELMKKLIEEKKNKNNGKNKDKRAAKSMGKASKGVRIGNGGGLFDR